MVVTVVALSNLFPFAATADSALPVAPDIPSTAPLPCLLRSSMSSTATVFLPLILNSDTFFWKTDLFSVFFLRQSRALSSVCFIKITNPKISLPVSFWSFIPLGGVSNGILISTVSCQRAVSVTVGVGVPRHILITPFSVMLSVKVNPQIGQDSAKARICPQSPWIPTPPLCPQLFRSHPAGEIKAPLSPLPPA